MIRTNTKTKTKRPEIGQKGSLMKIYVDESNAVSISEGNVKMGKVPSFSVLPGVTCPVGVPCLRDCYARKMCRRRDSTATAYRNNLNAVKNCSGKKIAEIISAYIRRKNVKFFRFNVSGDFNLPGYWEIAVKVAKSCPETKFLAFTKCYELQKRVRPENFTLVLSAWNEYNPGKNPKCGVAYMNDGTSHIPDEAVPCTGKCAECFFCFLLRKGEAVVFKKH